MKKWVLSLCLIFCIQNASIKLFANTQTQSLFDECITYESLNIQNSSPDDYHRLSDSHASRGENYLMLGDNQKALEDFMLSYEYASTCKIKKTHMLFRPLLGAFLAYARLENLESTRDLYVHLDSMLKNDCSESIGTSFNFNNRNSHAISFQLCHADHPILGPDRIAIKDCIERVGTTFNALCILISPIKKSEISALAMMLINQLADTAYTCCKEGGLWKACLQPLVNKLHYWKVLGIPADPMWD